MNNRSIERQYWQIRYRDEKNQLQAKRFKDAAEAEEAFIELARVNGSAKLFEVHESTETKEIKFADVYQNVLESMAGTRGGNGQVAQMPQAGEPGGGFGRPVTFQRFPQPSVARPLPRHTADTAPPASGGQLVGAGASAGGHKGPGRPRKVQ